MVFFEPKNPALSLFFDLRDCLRSHGDDRWEAVEVGLVEREGLLGSVHLLGKQLGSARCFMQIAGTGIRIEFRKLERVFLQKQESHCRVLHYVQCGRLVLTQFSACNRVHEVEERLARLLLMIEDRLGQPDLSLTQDFWAKCSDRRFTVTVVAATLQRGGLIEFRRGQVKVLDRERLETVACECYAKTRTLFQNLYADRFAPSRQTVRWST